MAEDLYTSRAYVESEGQGKKRKMNAITKWVLPAALMAFSASAFATPNFITNGSFTAPNVGSGWGFFTSGTGWTSDDPVGVEIDNSNMLGLGTTILQSMEINGNGLDTDSQTITGLAAGNYSLSWLYGSRVGSGNTAMAVYWDGKLITEDSSDGSISAWNVAYDQFTVAASGTGTDTLAFKALYATGNNTYGNEVANVSLVKGSVTATPEPSTWLLMLSGVVILGVLIKRQNSAASGLL